MCYYGRTEKLDAMPLLEYALLPHAFHVVPVLDQSVPNWIVHLKPKGRQNDVQTNAELTGTVWVEEWACASFPM